MKDEDRIHKIMHGGKHVANIRTYRGRAGGSVSQAEHPDGSSASKKYNIDMMDTKKQILSKIKKYHSAKNEQEDPREYGFEGEMAMSQLKGIMMFAKNLHDMLEPETDLPEWVQSKITLAYDYIQTASDYMATEMSEEAPANAVGGGKVAGLGVGPQGEPGGKARMRNRPLKRLREFREMK